MKHGASLAQKPIRDQTPSPGLLSTSSDSSSRNPRKLWDGPSAAALGCAPGKSPADQRGAAPLPPLRPWARALTEIRCHPGEPGALTRFVPPRAPSFLSSPPSALEALPMYPQGSWEHLPGSLALAAAPGAGLRSGMGETAAVAPGRSCPFPASHGSPAPFQLLQLSARHALRSFWPCRFLINFISMAQRSADRLIAVLVLPEPGADLSLQIWGELGAARRENRLEPAPGNPLPTGQI